MFCCARIPTGLHWEWDSLKAPTSLLHYFISSTDRGQCREAEACRQLVFVFSEHHRCIQWQKKTDYTGGRGFPNPHYFHMCFLLSAPCSSAPISVLPFQTLLPHLHRTFLYFTSTWIRQTQRPTSHLHFNFFFKPCACTGITKSEQRRLPDCYTCIACPVKHSIKPVWNTLWNQAIIYQN